jgi:tRNA dimethylallyltransferase
MAKQSEYTPRMITILGPTATGKTSLAALVAHRLDGEIISADSRQVYRGMDLGTGKDYDDYIVGGKNIPCHLVDIAEPGYEYNVFEFQRDFLKTFEDITGRGKIPVLCGGTGMYLEAVLSGYLLQEVPENHDLRKELESKSLNQLNQILAGYRKTHNITDATDKKRAIRAIEIEEYKKRNPQDKHGFPEIDHQIFGIHFERDEIRERITFRLKQRLDEGMVDEVKTLLNLGLKPGQLTFYGLEYRYLTEYVTGKISYDEMFKFLNTAIHQFAKRQMTWFRRMEKKGIRIEWIDGSLRMGEKVDRIVGSLGK